MKNLILTVAMLTAGCGGPVMTVHPALTMNDGCQLREVWYEAALFDPIVIHNFETARDMLDQAGIIAQGEFCSWMGNMHVEIVHANHFAAFGGPDDGCYDAFKGITIGGNMTALVHEILHSVDMARLDLATPFHEGWHDVHHVPGATLSFYDLDDQYGKAAVSPVCVSGTQPIISP